MQIDKKPQTVGMPVTPSTVELSTLSPGSTFMVRNDTEIYYLCGAGVKTGGDDRPPVINLSTGNESPGLTPQTQVIPTPYKAVPV